MYRMFASTLSFNGDLSRWAFGEESKKKTNTMREMFYGALCAQQVATAAAA